MIRALLILALAAPPLDPGAQNVTIIDPSNPKLRVTTTTNSGKQLLDVNCPTCSGGGGSSGSDGGYTVVIQGPLLDGGLAWVTTPPAALSVNNAGACVSVSTTTAVLSSNAARRSASLCARVTNTDTTFVKLGLTATTSNFPLEPGQCFNLTAPGSIYTGEIDAVANSGTQSICVVEVN